MKSILGIRTRTVMRASVILVVSGVIFLFPSILHARTVCPPLSETFGCCQSTPPPN